MQGNETSKAVLASVFIFFGLLAALFGANIMTFIFGQLGPTAAGLTVSDVGYNESLAVQNASLQGIKVYAESSSTQFNVVSITIILILLVGVFIFFWKTFMGNGKKGAAMGGAFG